MILQAISGTCFHLSKISGICFHLSEITISLRFWKLDLGNISLRFLKTCFHLSKISETCFHLSLRLYFSKILNTPLPMVCFDILPQIIFDCTVCLIGSPFNMVILHKYLGNFYSAISCVLLRCLNDAHCWYIEPRNREKSLN